MGWTLNLDDKENGFIGREALLRQRDKGIARRPMGIEFPDLSFLPDVGDPVFVDGQVVGAVTSSDRGWFVRKSLAMAYVPPDLVGQVVTVGSPKSDEGREGLTTDRPFCDPDGVRIRG